MADNDLSSLSPASRQQAVTSGPSAGGAGGPTPTISHATNRFGLHGIDTQRKIPAAIARFGPPTIGLTPASSSSRRDLRHTGTSPPVKPITQTAHRTGAAEILHKNPAGISSYLSHINGGPGPSGETSPKTVKASPSPPPTSEFQKAKNLGKKTLPPSSRTQPPFIAPLPPIIASAAPPAAKATLNATTIGKGFFNAHAPEIPLEKQVDGLIEDQRKRPSHHYSAPAENAINRFFEKDPAKFKEKLNQLPTTQEGLLIGGKLIDALKTDSPGVKDCQRDFITRFLTADPHLLFLSFPDLMFKHHPDRFIALLDEHACDPTAVDTASMVIFSFGLKPPEINTGLEISQAKAIIDKLSPQGALALCKQITKEAAANAKSGNGALKNTSNETRFINAYQEALGKGLRRAHEPKAKTTTTPKPTGSGAAPPKASRQSGIVTSPRATLNVGDTTRSSTASPATVKPEKPLGEKIKDIFRSPSEVLFKELTTLAKKSGVLKIPQNDQMRFIDLYEKNPQKVLSKIENLKKDATTINLGVQLTSLIDAKNTFDTFISLKQLSNAKWEPEDKNYVLQFFNRLPPQYLMAVIDKLAKKPSSVAIASQFLDAAASDRNGDTHQRLLAQLGPESYQAIHAFRNKV